MSRKRKGEFSKDNKIVINLDGTIVSKEEKPIVRVRPKVPFAFWFDKAQKAGKVKQYQEVALLVYFKKQGLTKIENEDKYNEALKSF